MINYDTIISNFDDKVTLYNWLRKVEEALKNASATNFVVNKKGNATLSFSITFADGETLESGDIVLQQGESVDQARIASGVLQLHLTNGTWLTAGNIKPVTNFEINASQHLIVNYQDDTSQDLGAIFTGNVNINGNFTANSIIETMSGYNFERQTADNYEFTYEYAGAVKNGNKLTFSLAMNVKKIADETGSNTITIGKFILPASVGHKLVPSTLGTYANNLDAKQIIALQDQQNGIAIIVSSHKINDARIDILLMNARTLLTAGTTYKIRYEVTFLLSNNLAQ